MHAAASRSKEIIMQRLMHVMLLLQGGASCTPQHQRWRGVTSAAVTSLRWDHPAAPHPHGRHLCPRSFSWGPPSSVQAKRWTQQRVMRACAAFHMLRTALHEIGLTTLDFLITRVTFWLRLIPANVGAERKTCMTQVGHLEPEHGHMLWQ